MPNTVVRTPSGLGQAHAGAGTPEPDLEAGHAPVSAATARYLEAAYYIRAEGEVIRRGRLADWLDVSAPSVTQAVSRFVREGLLREGPSHSVELTDEGDQVAAEIVRRHRIVEAWLVATLGLDWAAADEEAHRLAYAFSDDVLDRLHESLGRPWACPHGNPIPGERQPPSRARRLVEVPLGSRGRIFRVSEVTEHQAPEVLDSLYRLGLTPTTEITLLRLNPDGSATVKARARPATLQRPVARAVWITNDESG
jgi:DtxR family transcriptional regulator, Mn-dependent transcriptional regulator